MPKKDNALTTKQTAVTTKNALLDKLRAAKPASQLAGTAPAGKLENRRPRLVFGVDATASREAMWDEAKQVTDSLFTEIPGALDVALAVHGGSRLHTFTDFSADVAEFRAQAMRIHCRAGQTVLCEMMRRTLTHTGVKVLTYIGDAFEESPEAAFQLANDLRARGCKMVILADNPDDRARAVFEELARRTGGAVMDFWGQKKTDLRDIFQAVAALAIGGVKLLKEKQTPAAKLLLQHINKNE